MLVSACYNLCAMVSFADTGVHVWCMVSVADTDVHVWRQERQRRIKEREERMRERELQLELERIEEMERAKEREERLLLRSMTDAQRLAYLATKEAAGMRVGVKEICLVRSRHIGLWRESMPTASSLDLCT